jgi:hypothetical protein
MRTQWRRAAAECLEAMRATTNPEIKVMLLAMAERWAERAERAERQSGLASARPTARSEANFGIEGH